MDAATRIESVASWWRTLPEDKRPDQGDAEACARLGVRDQRSLERLVLKDTVSMARHFAGLLSAIDAGVAPPGTDPEADDGREGDELPRADEPTSRPPTHDPRAARVRAYVDEAETGQSWSTRLDDAWVTRLLDDSAALAEMPVTVARKHRAKLQELLGGEGAAKPVADASPEMFSLEPDAYVRHESHHRISFEPGPADSIRLAWPDVPEAAAWFKVYAGGGIQKPLLYAGRLVGEGPDRQVLEDVALDGGRRLYAVWVHAGEDLASATKASPRLWAEGALIAPVHHAHVTSDDGRVSATWTVEPGVERVEVHRLPAAAAGTRTASSESSMVGGDLRGANLTGFEEAQVPPGQYVYRFSAVATIDGVAHHSVPTEHPVDVHVRVPAVDDLQVDVVGETGRLRASWPVIEGVQVELHCTGEELAPGAREHQLDQAGVERQGLGSASRVNWPAIVSDERAVVEWEWPEGQSRVHVVAVSVVDGVYRVGAVQVRVRLGAVTHATLHERVHQQYLTFAWPSGASSVEVRQSNQDPEEDPAHWRLLAEIDRHTYRREGGVRLHDLPSGGTQLAVLGSAVEGGRQLWGAPALLDYAGLRTVTYSFVARGTAQPPARSLWFRRERTVETAAAGQALRVECSPPESVELVLVTRPDRIPLHQNDTQDGRGHVLRLGKLGPEGVGSFETGSHEGWRRLFLVLPDVEQPLYAVLDPAVSQLRGGTA